LHNAIELSSRMEQANGRRGIVGDVDLIASLHENAVCCVRFTAREQVRSRRGGFGLSAISLIASLVAFSSMRGGKSPLPVNLAADHAQCPDERHPVRIEIGLVGCGNGRFRGDGACHYAPWGSWSGACGRGLDDLLRVGDAQAGQDGVLGGGDVGGRAEGPGGAGEGAEGEQGEFVGDLVPDGAGGGLGDPDEEQGEPAEDDVGGDALFQPVGPCARVPARTPRFA
jgi:hypothetical protein